MGSGPLARSVLAGLVGLSLAGLPAAAFAQSGKEASSAGKRWEEEFSLWQKVSSGSDIAQYEGYLKQYPNGTFASMARLRIAELDAAAKAKPAAEADTKATAEAGKAKADEAAAADKVKAEAEAKKTEEAAARKLADEKAAAEQRAKAEADAKKAEEEAAARKLADEKAVAAEKAKAEAARLKAEADAKKAEEAAAARKLAEEKAAAEKAKAEAAAAEKARADEAARLKAEADAAAVKAKAEEAARRKAEEAAAAEKARAEQEAVARREAEAKRVEAEKAAAAEKARIEQEAAAARKLAEEKQAEVERLKAEAAKAAAEAEAKAAEAARLAREAEKRAGEAAAARTTEEAGKAERAKREEEAFQKAVVAGTQQAFRSYLDTYPDGRFASDARERLSALADTARQKVEPKRKSETAKLDDARREPVVDAREAYLGRAGRAQAQRWLSLLGFNTYGADGVFGPRSRAAIAAWQDASGYRPDGYLTRPQYRALRQAADYAAARQRRYQRDYDVLEGPVDGYYDGPYYRDDGDYRGGGGMVIIPGY